MSDRDPDSTPRLPDARAAALSALESEFSELITHFRRLITENADRVSPGMLPGAYKAFTTIARRGPLTASALSERMGIDKGQLSRTIRDLEKLDLVERSPDPGDRRSFLLSLTALGRERLVEARIPQEGMLMHHLTEWSVTDIDSLTRLLRALGSGITPAPGS